MSKGNLAKENLLNLMITSLPAGTYVGCFDKKHYFWSTENGEKMQVAITMTCPKTLVGDLEKVPIVAGGMDFSAPVEEKIKPEVISEQEQETIEELMKKLGLI